MASLERPLIQGARQGVLVRGRDSKNPTLLILHGGPGGAYIGEARAWFGFLEPDWVVVNWDMRGAGLSHSRAVAPGSLTGAQIALDAEELVAWLRERFHLERIHLLAHSFGTVVAPYLLQRMPKAFERYIAVGPAPTDADAETESYDWTLARAKEAGNRRAVRALERIGAPPYRTPYGGLNVRARWTNRLGGALDGRAGDDLAFQALRFGTENTWGDLFLRVLPGTNFWMRNMDDSLSATPKFDCPIPLTVIQGTKDWMAPASATRRSFQRWRAPSKNLVEIQEVGHYPFVEAPDRFCDALKLMPA